MKDSIFWIIGLLIILGIGIFYITWNPEPKLVKTFKYNEHTMLEFKAKGYISICHSPTCDKCYQIFD